MTSAGYIRNQACPENPTHGNVYRIGTGYYCPHAEHNKPGRRTAAFWSMDEWEKIKNDPQASMGESQSASARTTRRTTPAEPPTNRAANKPIRTDRGAGKNKRPKRRSARPA